METNVLPFLSTQKRQGGAGGGEVKEEETVGILQGTLTLPSHLQGLDAC